jgi:hypothetical protein
MFFEPYQIVECAKYIFEDSNRGFWARLGAQGFESLLSKAQYILNILSLRSAPPLKMRLLLLLKKMRHLKLW